MVCEVVVVMVGGHILTIPQETRPQALKSVLV